MSKINAVRVAVYSLAKDLDLKPFKRITFKFDPFHHNAAEVRDSLHLMSSSRVRQTNVQCVLKTEVTRTAPCIELQLNGGKNVLIRASDLTQLEILEVVSRLGQE
uniref:Large ribosomal subunit protein mL53 n=1 Tax=Ornithodoros turicata TaxID=34597 RepID=A0A2R5L8P0_9ACAR